MARPSADRGAVAVEFALLLIVSMPLAFGTISAGTAYSKHINVTQAARETSRFGATLSLVSAGGDVHGWLDKVSVVGAAAAGPSTDPLGGHDRLCVAMIDLNVAEYNKHKINGGASADGPCPGTAVNTALGPRYVQVALERKTSFFAVVVNEELTLRSVSSTPYEPGDDAP